MNEEVKTIQYYDFLFAGFGQRFFAYIIDLIIIWCITLFINGPLILLGFNKELISIGYVEIGLFAIIFPIYFSIFTKLTNGQTLGKMILCIRVVCFVEEKLSWKTVIVREVFGRYIQKVIPLLYLICIFTPKKQHLADLFSDTSVISEVKIEIMNKSKSLVKKQESLI